MLQDYNKWKILQQFFFDPSDRGEGFKLRELSKSTELAPLSVHNYLNELLKEDLIVKKKARSTGYPIYFANRKNERFRFLKKINTILLLTDVKEKKLKKTLVEYLIFECFPDVIVLFGSASRGEDVLESDMDLFVQSKEKELKFLELFEKITKRKIILFFKSDFNTLPKELKTNIINGIILYGNLNLKF